MELKESRVAKTMKKKVGAITWLDFKTWYEGTE